MEFLIYFVIGFLVGGYYLGIHAHESRSGFNDFPVPVEAGITALFWPIYLASLPWRKKNDRS